MQESRVQALDSGVMGHNQGHFGLHYAPAHGERQVKAPVPHL